MFFAILLLEIAPVAPETTLMARQSGAPYVFCKEEEEELTHNPEEIPPEEIVQEKTAQEEIVQEEALIEQPLPQTP